MNGEEWEEKGQQFIRTGDYEKAIECFEKALKLIPYSTIYILSKEVEVYKAIGDEQGELFCFNRMLDHSPGYASALLGKGIILINRGEFDEAILLLDRMYGCESHDTLWAPALFQKARAAAIQGKQEEMIENLKKAMRTTIFFDFSSGHYSKQDLIQDIENTSEFDKYRDMEEFQFVMSFEWEREDEIDLENRINHYLREKGLQSEQLDPIYLGLIEYLCKYPESEIYLDFDLYEEYQGLGNKSKSIIIVTNDNKVLKELKSSRKVTYKRDDTMPFSWILEEIRRKTRPSEKNYSFDGISYKKSDIENALKIFKEYVHAFIPDRPHPLILSSTHSLGGGEEYKRCVKRTSYDYSVLILPVLDDK